jgi:hypothetical protein
MKRCPQCEFIYEEDQRLCDMDGTALIHDSHLLLENDPRTPRAKSIWKLFVQIGLPLIVLSVLAFYVFKHQTSAQNSTPSTTVVNSSERSSSPAAPSESRAQQHESVFDAGAVDNSKANAAEGPKRTDDGSNTGAAESERNAPSSNLTGTDTPIGPGKTASGRAFSTVPRRQPSRQSPQKKDSKVTSLLKKTGRFLAKPFK